MKHPPRICAFYSQGPHFMKLIAALRERYPEGHITAIIPPEYPPELLEGRVDDYILRSPRIGARSLAALLSATRLLRSGDYTIIAIMFPSLRLRLLARASRAREALYATPDGRLHPVRFAPLRELARALTTLLTGRLRYAWIWLIIRACPVRPPKK